MARQNEKVAADKQPQRGKSRFGVQPSRPARVVLPDRPPREIDNEIVSILLGADPAALAAQASEEAKAAAAPAPVIVPPPVSEPESAAVVEISPAAESVGASEPAEPSRTAATTATPPPETRQPRASRSEARTSPVFEAAPASTLAETEAPSPAAVPRVPARKASLPAPADGEQAISSFTEFAERWRHGLRKGQLKVCEVLYQKTHAVGETQCVTSFAELGRLSGLKMRQCFNIIAQLEALKFVERAKSEATSNKKDQGSIIRFYLFPKS